MEPKYKFKDELMEELEELYSGGVLKTNYRRTIWCALEDVLSTADIRELLEYSKEVS